VVAHRVPNRRVQVDIKKVTVVRIDRHHSVASH
jgi:hypothetical protein